MLIAEVHDDPGAENASVRFDADAIMRQRLDEMTNECPAPRLWGLSLFGTSLRVYYCDIANGAITPTLEELPGPYIIRRNFFERRWDMDILYQEGFELMKEIITNIVSAV